MRSMNTKNPGENPCGVLRASHYGALSIRAHIESFRYMTVAELGVERDLLPVVIGVVDGFFELAEQRAVFELGLADVPQLSLDALEDRFGPLMTKTSSLLMRETALVRTALQAIEF